MRDDKASEVAEKRYRHRGGMLAELGAEGFTEGAAWQREQPVEITDEMVEAARRAINEEGAVLYTPIIRAALEAALNTATTPAADHVHDDFGDCCVARAREKWRAEHPGEEPENVSRLNGKHS
jgi:hypothetical protein